MKSVVLLGSTGSIGESTLRVVADNLGEFRVTALAARTNAVRLVEQARQFGVKCVALASHEAAAKARVLAPELEVLAGDEGVTALAAEAEAEVALCALVGMAGLRPTLAAIDAGKDVALATKEVLVAAGAVTMQRRAARGVRLLPVDSEHNAIFQCLQSAIFEPACVRSSQTAPERYAEARLRRLILTASGGPFANKPEIDFSSVTVDQALNHPRWRMGPKVTIDSATMMNKGLEVIEAHWLYNMSVDKIDVVVHPQSIVHSLVEFSDRAVLAQLSPPDMRFAIQYALSWPERLAADLPPLDLAALAELTFSKPDEGRFRALALARQAIECGGTMPAVLNGANEVAVATFLQGGLTFDTIAATVEETMLRHNVSVSASETVEGVEDADAWARREAAKITARYASRL
ncbi:MAG: 1-deoxy-D-xylulose-5-phosphate reductoisomerase [Lentisphaerae bacterium]|jgi:1-deoxy-D-xylulose-5-phosphate reductoisomerase|nr:1-deoxy-D-xylulose-5-phosphate reductoisomerase [Lentisphaerota bacterium]